jgi:hypothetical protein
MWIFKLAKAAGNQFSFGAAGTDNSRLEIARSRSGAGFVEKLAFVVVEFDQQAFACGDR